MANHKNREIRGMVLKIIYSNYPEQIGDTLIKEILEDSGYVVSEQDIKANIDYLQGGGYIESNNITNKGLGISRTVCKLTPKGINLIEGNIEEDPGIEVI